VLAQTLKTKRRTNEAQEPAARTVDAVSLQLKDRSMRRPKKAHYVHQLGLYSVAAPDICGRISQVFTTGRSQGCRAGCCSGGLRYREATERYGRDQCGRSAAPCRFNHSFARRIRAKPKCERSHWPDHQDRQPGQVTIVARGPQRGSLLVLGTLTSV